MKKITGPQFDIVEKLIEQFMREHTREEQQTVKQFKAWLEVNFMVQEITRGGK